MGDLNKTYYGYKPKENNLVKLERYLTVKNSNKTKISDNSSKSTKLTTNQVLKNKRF